MMLRKMAMAMVGIAALGAVMMGLGCDNKRDKAGEENQGKVKIEASTKVDEKLSGKIEIDGSSTVYPVSQAVAEEFKKLAGGVKISVGSHGTGAGFKRFCAGETDICDASRPISKSEIELCAKNGVEYMGLPVAYDGLSVVVNKKNDWCTDLTVAELKKIWEPDSTVTKWSDVRAGFPDKKIKLFGAGHDSGTFDYFTEEICGKKAAIRKDYAPSEDDNQLVTGVIGDEGAMGFFGFAYYVNNKDKLNVLKVNGVLPTDETIRTDTYKPLSRQIYVYVSEKALERPELQAFVKFYLEVTGQVAHQVGYTPLPEAIGKQAMARFEKREWTDAAIRQ